MNSRSLILSLFAALVVIQLGVPLSMISKRELTLREGTVYKFRTAPVDPADIFRGRYVALQFDQRTVAVTNGEAWHRNQKVIATLTTNAEGFAVIDGLVDSAPADRAYLKTKVQYGYGTNVSLQLPFDRYYMNEKSAPQAERAYWDNSRRTNSTTYATIRILDGFAVLEELYISGVPVKDYLKGKRQP